jgi:hypothetical protein
MAYASDVVGTNSGDGVTYLIGDVDTNTVIDDAKWDDILSKVNSERQRRGHGTVADPGVTAGQLIDDADYNIIRDALYVDGPVPPSYEGNADGSAISVSSGTNSPPTFSFTRAGSGTSPDAPTASQGGNITASQINTLIDALQNQGAECVCNCNYCTCNCNYCTCNCNYACTCNCNYSDVTTKQNIVYM